MISEFINDAYKIYEAQLKSSNIYDQDDLSSIKPLLKS